MWPQVVLADAGSEIYSERESPGGKIARARTMQYNDDRMTITMPHNRVLHQVLQNTPLEDVERLCSPAACP